MILILKYNTNRYEPATIARLLQHLMIVLEGMSAQPEPRVADVPLLTITEEQQILFAWNETATEYPRELSLSELFEAQAARTPEAVALLFEDTALTALTYRELNERANQLARYLQRAGVGPEVVVGILLNRSVEMIVAVLGVLKAGGAYVALDPGDPVERLAFMIHDSELRLLLTRETVSEISNTGATLNVTEQWDLVAGESVANLPSSAHPESLAYVTYTSDSAGQSHGVMIQQRSVINLATALQHSIYKEYEAGLRLGSCAALASDALVQQVVQLVHGHTLCILPEEAQADGQQLLDYIKRYQLDSLNCTPSHLKLLGESEVAELLALTPQLVLVGREALEETVWASLVDNRETRSFNLYGPTECTVFATVSEVRAELPASTIGRPMSNVKLYVLDQQQQPVGIGVAGEIYIGGDGVGRGYLNRPELTAERFIPHPYSAEAGARLYRTGDVGRYLKDGNIEHLGRLEDQVKLRGFRRQFDAPHVLPRTEAEHSIAEVWQEVLQLQSVGIFDNFFDVGGHSLLMVQVHDQLRERFKFEISLVELFEYPSINSLAEHLSRQKDVTPIQDENLVLANKLREGRNRLRQQRATRA
jgi:amino acid adenylation domain-containing protein